MLSEEQKQEIRAWLPLTKSPSEANVMRVRVRVLLDSYDALERLLGEG